MPFGAVAMSNLINFKSVVVTRDEPSNGPLCSGLRKLGLRVLWWPVVRISPPDDAGPLELALSQAEFFDWITFASQHAVAAVTSRLDLPPADVRVAAVGKRTADALQEKGWHVDLVPEEATAEGLVYAMTSHIRTGTRVLFPASSRALPTLSAGLRKLGAIVQEVEAYRTEPASLDIDQCHAQIERDEIGAVTFTSPSAVDELDNALGNTHFNRLLSHSAPVALGPTTGRALADRGYSPVLAHPQSLQGLADTTYRLMQTRS
jgi:uroporphyrinogen-III synthase